MTRAPDRRARSTGAVLVHQLRTVAADLPLMIAGPLYRRRHLRWGATPGEMLSRMPGDDLVPHAQFQCTRAVTRAVTIDAPPVAVWPWLVQVGCGRAGWYSNDLLDNLGCPSAREILPELQHLEVGQWVPMAPTPPSQTTALRVDGFEVPRWVALAQTGQHVVLDVDRTRRREDPARDPGAPFTTGRGRRWPYSASC